MIRTPSNGTIMMMEVWDRRPGSYRRLCSIHEWLDGGREDAEGQELSTAAKADAELIVCALNRVTRE